MAEPRVLIAGASGFAGAIAARLIDRHPHFTLGALTSRSDVGRTLDELTADRRRHPTGDLATVIANGEIDGMDARDIIDVQITVASLTIADELAAAPALTGRGACPGAVRCPVPNPFRTSTHGLLRSANNP